MKIKNISVKSFLSWGAMTLFTAYFTGIPTMEVLNKMDETKFDNKVESLNVQIDSYRMMRSRLYTKDANIRMYIADEQFNGEISKEEFYIKTNAWFSSMNKEDNAIDEKINKIKTGIDSLEQDYYKNERNHWYSWFGLL